MLAMKEQGKSVIETDGQYEQRSRPGCGFKGRPAPICSGETPGDPQAWTPALPPPII